MKEGYVRVNNVQLHYVEEGRGALVVLLHGFPDFWYGWRKQIPALSGSYRVVAPDMRGYNLSDKPGRVKDYRLDILASDIAALIKSFGGERAIVVGHDWGGTVAWALATQYPELVAKLAVLNCPYPSELKRALLKANLTQWKKSYYIFVFQLPRLPEWFIGRNLAQFFKGVFQKMSPHAPHASADATVAEYVKAYSQPGALTATINYYRAAMRYHRDLPRTASRFLSMPVLMIWGEQDNALGKELTYRTRNYCSDLEIVYDPSSNHFVQLDNPELVNTTLLEFFKK